MNNPKPYKKYKPSNIAWLGEIPEHWEVRKLKYSDKVNMGQSPNSEDCNMDRVGLPFLQGNAEFGKFYPIPKLWCSTSNKIAEENDILLSVRAPIGAINFASEKTGIGRGLCAITAQNTQIRYLYYSLINLKKELNSIGTGSTFKAISVDDVRNISLVSPPLSEQQKIANFLDYKLSKIDRFIQKKKQLIKLLNEQKAGIINDAVTKGLDQNAKMKPSDIEWLGSIPEHWEVRKLKYVAKICNGSDCEKQEGIYPVYGSGGIFGWTHNYIYDKPSVLLGRKGTIDKPILVTKPFWTVDTAFYTKIKDNVVSPLFFYYLCCNIPFKFYSSKTALPSMTQTSLYEVKFGIPPLSEQTAIVTHIEKETAQINLIIQTIEKEIALTQEYRTALIAEAVTGKIDVREYEIPEMPIVELYEELEEEMSLAAEGEGEYLTEN